MRRVVLFKWSTRIVWKMFKHNPEKKYKYKENGHLWNENFWKEEQITKS